MVLFVLKVRDTYNEDILWGIYSTEYLAEAAAKRVPREAGVPHIVVRVLDGG